MNIAHCARLALTGAIALGLAACGGGEDKDTEGTSDTAIAPTTVAPAFASLTGDAVKGERVFIQCKTCHAVEPNEHRVGPSLHGIVGRPAGQAAGFNYSAANKSSSLMWTEEQLYAYLEAPQKAMPGTKMAYAGLKQPQDRADVIAFLATKK